MDRRSQVLGASGLNILAGLWLIISPFVLGYFNLGRAAAPAGASAATSVDLIVGFVIALMAVIRFFGVRKIGVELFHNQTVWLSWGNVVLGLVLIVSPFLLQFTDVSAAYWNNIIVGVIVVILSAWNALVSRPAVT